MLVSARGSFAFVGDSGSASGGGGAVDVDRGFEVLGDPVRNPEIVESRPRDELPPGDCRWLEMVTGPRQRGGER